MIDVHGGCCSKWLQSMMMVWPRLGSFLNVLIVLNCIHNQRRKPLSSYQIQISHPSHQLHIELKSSFFFKHSYKSIKYWNFHGIQPTFHFVVHYCWQFILSSIIYPEYNTYFIQIQWKGNSSRMFRLAFPLRKCSVWFGWISMASFGKCYCWTLNIVVSWNVNEAQPISDYYYILKLFICGESHFLTNPF